MSIDWLAFVIVAVVSIGSAALIVALFATGLRLLSAERMRRAARVAASACFVVAAAAVLFGIWLLVPAFHAA